MTKVWITRTRPGADHTAKRVRTEGFEPIIAPLLTVSPADEMPAIPDPGACLIFTSKNGVSAFCELTNLRTWDVVTVGDGTADEARHNGFKAVLSASGTAKEVVQLIQTRIPKTQPILHCSGETVRGTIVSDLEALGYTARRTVLYKTTPVTTLPLEDVSSINYVLLHSPRAAKTLRNLSPDLSQTITVSISKAADTELNGLSLRERRIAVSPDERAIIAALLA